MTCCRILVGDVRERLRDLEDASIHCVVTSPPYWGLRDYGVPGQIGLEDTPDAYVAAMVDVFRAVRRVLRDDGTLWVNLGDTYATGFSKSNTRDPKSKGRVRRDALGQPNRGNVPGFDQKQMIGIPWRVALALQADGWWLRRDFIWWKDNPMPESCTDRGTTAHEYVFHFTKAPRYFYDGEPVREDVTGTAHARGSGVNPKSRLKSRSKQNTSFSGAINKLVTSRNMRSVWRIPTQAFPEAHFATFPEELARRCILPGTSERGACPECGAPWERIVERVSATQKVPDGWDTAPGKHGRSNREYMGKHQETDRNSAGRRMLLSNHKHRAAGADHDHPHPRRRTVGWKPTCDHEHTPVPCQVLDPFGGAGTAGLVAIKLGRDATLIELSPEYAEMARRRIVGAMGLLAEVSVS